MAKSGRLELGDNIYGHYRSTFNQCDVFGQQSNRIRWKTQKGLLRRSRSSKVTEFGINRKLICDFLLVINTNLAPILHRLRDSVRSIGPKSLYSATPLVDDLRKILPGCQQMAIVPNGVETLPKISVAWVGWPNVTDRQTTDRRRDDDI